jgi:hypothetical protein
MMSWHKPKENHFGEAEDWAVKVRLCSCAGSWLLGLNVRNQDLSPIDWLILFFFGSFSDIAA